MIRPRLTIEQLRGRRCRDRDAVQGELHERGCFQEHCSICGGQAVTCGHYNKRRARRHRVPFIAWTNVCTSCGTLRPELFSVPGKVWEHYIEPTHRRDVVCEPCFRWIAHTIDGGAYMERHGVPAALWSLEYRRRHKIPPDKLSPFDGSVERDGVLVIPDRNTVSARR